ncbi:maltose acetyltransferase domain-containing protein [Blautia sp. Marseille-P3201T]|uniref:maltose acetyltransferase domain-containing protein n=1 Tax=Blautia sp. Marseille-P3201T TaxID=1907659 RepID=UPI000931E84B|nr:maltose acetyltransferase domain-containing protein [Blautia sp. Marseille-P3201T]
MTERERMEKGILYDPADEEIMAEQFPYLDALKEFNELPSSEVEKREKLMKAMFAKCDHCHCGTSR